MRLDANPAGDNAIGYFQETFPQVAPFGEAGSYQNPAEWIVDLTTKVCSSQTPS